MLVRRGMEILVEWVGSSNMKKQAVVFVCIFFLTGLTACGVPTPGSLESTQPAEERPSEIASAMLTAAAQAENAIPTVVLPQPYTPTSFISTRAVDTPIAPPVERSRTPQPRMPSGISVQLPCNVAHPGRPIDVTVPDETRFSPGETFSKTWRLVNAGSCPWTNAYTVIWFSGEDIGITRAQSLLWSVLPGASMDITVEMVAPQQPGVYQSNWKLRSERGELFGIGPEGDSPFWVRIVVEAVETDTPTPAPPEATETPLIYSGGFLSMLPADGIDLDNVALNQAEEDDLRLEQVEEALAQLSPVNGARLSFFGFTAPQQDDCLTASLSEQPLKLEQIQAGAFLCYRTTQGLPGRLYLAAIDPQTNQVDLDFLTWAVP